MSAIFDDRLIIERKVHDLRVGVSDLMSAYTKAETADFLRVHEPELLSALCGLQFLCSAMKAERQKQIKLEAAE